MEDINDPADRLSKGEKNITDGIEVNARKGLRIIADERELK